MVYLEVVKEIVEPMTIILGVIIGIIGIWRVLAELRLKLMAETRLAKTAEIQSQVKLLEQFSSLMDIAECRKKYILCQELVEDICKENISLEEKHKKIERTIITFPVGLASKIAAIKAIEVLGNEHKVLEEPAQAALDQLKKSNKI